MSQPEPSAQTSTVGEAEPPLQLATAQGRRALLVAGVHRSGTSALTRTLSLVGGALADDLLEPVADNNERGFWEPKAIVDLHDRALSTAGSSWDDVTRFPDSWFSSDAARIAGDELLSLLEREFSGTPVFAIKDPRLCRLVPLWLSVLPRFQAQPQFVLPLRNPVEVAGSLHARDGFPMAKGYLIWLRNALDAERATQGWERVFVTYEDLLDDWRSVVDGIGRTLSISWPRLSRTAESEIEAFLSPGLRHQRLSWGDARRRRDVPGWVVDAYEAMLQLVDDNGKAAVDARRTMERVLEEINRADDTYGRALAGVGVVLEDVREQLARAGDQLARADERTDQVRLESELRTDQVRLESELRYEQLRAELNPLNDALIAQHETSTRLQSDLTLAQQEISRLTDERNQMQSSIEEVLRSRSWRLTSPLRKFRESARGLRHLRRSLSARAKPYLSVSGQARTAVRALRSVPLPPWAKARLSSALRRRFGHYFTAPLTDGTLEAAGLAAHVAPWQGDAVGILPADFGAVDRVLVVDWKVPTPDHDSGSYRMFKILSCLAGAGEKVDFVGAAPAGNPRYQEALEALGVQVFQGLDALLIHLAEQGAAYRCVILSRPEVAYDYLPVVRAFCVNARVIYDTVDLHWVRFARGGDVLEEAKHLHEKARSYRLLELANARSSDVTIAITEEEKGELLAEVPNLQVTVLPNIHELPPRGPPFAERRDLLFIGGFAHEPNVDAVHYMVKTILPHLAGKLAEVRVRIVGSDMPPDIRKLASDTVDVVGFVPEVESYFEQARLFVAPLRLGAGMKGKVGQALSFGLPVVTTSVGAEGIGLVDGDNALVSDDPEGFAARIVRAYSDEALWNRLSSKGRGIVVSRFSVDAVRPKVLALVGAGSR